MSRHREIVARLMERVKTMSLDELQRFVEKIESSSEDDEEEEEDEEDEEDDEDDDEEDEDKPAPIPDRWPGNIKFGRWNDRDPVVQASESAFANTLENVIKIHGFGAQVCASGDPSMQIAFAAAFARRKAFGDLVERLGTVPPPYDRDEILEIVNALDDPPWETASTSGAEVVAVLAGQWLCPCGYRNNDLRRRCRDCSRRNP